MPSKIFVNLPVKDVKRSIAFFKQLGYAFNPQFTTDEAGCMVISEDIFTMLLDEKHFKTFTPKAISDAKSTSEVLIALSFDSRAEVERVVEAAFKAGGRRYAEPRDHGSMYQSGFEDLDGHIWECFWMDPALVQK